MDIKVTWPVTRSLQFTPNADEAFIVAQIWERNQTAQALIKQPADVAAMGTAVRDAVVQALEQITFDEPEKDDGGDPEGGGEPAGDSESDSGGGAVV